VNFDNVSAKVERLSGDIYDAVGCHGYQVPYSEDCDIDRLRGRRRPAGTIAPRGGAGAGTARLRAARRFVGWRRRGIE